MKVSYDLTGVPNGLGLKSQAHKSSPLKWTEEYFSPLERTLAIRPEIDFRVIVVN